MFNINQQVKLFKEIKIEAYLNQQEQQIRNSIDRFSEATISSMDIERETKSLISSCNMILPELDKQNTSTSISSEKVSGFQFPSGTMFEPGKMYEIEIANYNIPFKGNSEFLKCLPKSFTNRIVVAELNRNSLIFKLTNYGKISGNENIINELKNELLRNIEFVETNLAELKLEVEQFIPTLEYKIKSYLENLQKSLEIKNDSKDKLNPFK